ncbi:MATE family efflux transporter [Marinimicrobium sp. ABcell2]|uniref:MATE family efflux transporter n=1 Tax=Marinimicrobium sp. ABcell2 TaxID=3069751 RepID=UPI0027B447A4|nr:MATE family efflux transporter [Marinimicrobium sp. ABcell2]MDQ2076244.1 MATE family efflux transporter [Marinimicrobium sp. ABcell2]
MISRSRRTHRQIWQLAWPMMLTNLSVPLLGAVDTAILGHLPSPVYLAAATLGASLVTLLLWSFGFLRMGTTSLVARAYGREDHDNSRLILAQSAVLGLLLGVSLAVLGRLLTPVALAWINPSEEVATLAQSYAEIRLLGAPAVLLTYALVGWFIGQQDTRRPLVILVSTNLLNIVLDGVFIWGLGLNSDGAAMASVVAEYAGLALGLWLLCKRLKGMGGRLATKHLTRPATYLPLLQVNRHLFVRTLCLLAVFVFFAAQGARLGDQVLAANAILLQFVLLTSHALDGFAHAAEALSGRAIGAGRRAEFFRICRASTIWALGMAVLVSLTFFLGQAWLLTLFTELESVLELASQYYLWVCLLPLVAVWAYQLDGLFLGSGKTAAMQYAMLISAGLVFLPLWWLTRGWGNQGLWLTFTVFNGARGLLMGAIFLHYSRAKTWVPAHPFVECDATPMIKRS